MATPRSSRRRQPVRTSQPSQGRRPTAASRSEPPDYTREYAFVRRDLLLIAVIGGLLLAAMVVASFVL
jgi:hypothetical protein